MTRRPRPMTGTIVPRREEPVPLPAPLSPDTVMIVDTPTFFETVNWYIEKFGGWPPLPDVVEVRLSYEAYAPEG